MRKKKAAAIVEDPKPKRERKPRKHEPKPEPAKPRTVFICKVCGGANIIEG